MTVHDKKLTMGGGTLPGRVCLFINKAFPN